MKERQRGITRRALIGAGIAAAGAVPDGLVRVTPRPVDDLFANPGTGWQTFHQFADHDRALQGLPSGGAYVRFYWREVEPREGEIDFPKLDGLFQQAARAGQKLSFRIMCVGTDENPMECPAWLKEKGCGGIEFRYENSPLIRWAPDWEDPLFQQAHFRLIRELGKRYDRHPSMDLLDIGTVGLWGEWHMSGCTVPSTGMPAPMPSVATRIAIIDAWRAAFPRTPKVMLIGDEPGMTHAVSHGCGWRADCLGDLGGFSRTWNHMDHFYLQQLKKTGAQEAWKTGPVAFESCWDMRKWVQEGWDVRRIFDYALACHASYMNNKSAPVPESARPEVERFLRRLGYRLVLRRLEHPEAVSPGGALPLRMEWENVGVAPPYRDWLLAFRLRPSAGDSSTAVIHRTRISIRGWLPGPKRVTETIRLPARIHAGPCGLDVGIVDAVSGRPAVRIAVAGVEPDLWHPVSRIQVR